jgi:phosphoesterase RecJ-like protein
LSRLRLQAALVEAVKFACDGRLAYAVLTPELRQQSGASGDDTEGLIDAIRVIEGVEVTCLIRPEDDAVRFSLRSRSAAYPVLPLARKLGGGGHAQAAGATVEKIGIEAAEQLLVTYAREVIDA